MAETFAYDLVSFLRVLYVRRWMILKGAVGITLLVAIATLIWPETWRADAKIFVNTPKYKETLRLIPKPYDVITYQAILQDDNLYNELITTLTWYREAVHRLVKNNKIQNESYRQEITAHLGERAGYMNPFELIQNTNLAILSKYVLDPDQLENTLYQHRVRLLGHLSAEELELCYRFDEDELEDLTVFDLRKMLRSSVTKVIETNLEVEYSKVIQVSAEFDTAAGAKMLANTWLELFLIRAEENVRSTIKRQVQTIRGTEQFLNSKVAAEAVQSVSMQNAANLNVRLPELAAKLVQLTGMNPNRKIAEQIEESFDLENENEPFMKERRQSQDIYTFTISPLYDQALLTKRSDLERRIATFKHMIELSGGDPAVVSKLAPTIRELEAELLAVEQQIQTLRQEIASEYQKIRDHELALSRVTQTINEMKNSLSAIRPLLDEANLLESQENNVQYADVSIGRAIKPDKRVFPKRSLMTALGLVVGFFLMCCWAFFMDIWNEVTRTESPSEMDVEPSGS